MINLVYEYEKVGVGWYFTDWSGHSRGIL